MNKLYDEYFHVPKSGRISEKVMIVRIVAMVIVVIVCMAAMSMSAYAYFSSNNVISYANVIKSANFDIAVTVIDGDTPVPLTRIDSKTYSAELKAGKTYTVMIDNDQECSTAETGFCVVTADGCGKIYHTQQIGKDTFAENSYTDRVIFSLSVTQDTVVYFTPHWGTSFHYPDFEAKGESHELYITNANTGENRIELVIDQGT